MDFSIIFIDCEHKARVKKRTDPDRETWCVKHQVSGTGTVHFSTLHFSRKKFATQ